MKPLELGIGSGTAVEPDQLQKPNQNRTNLIAETEQEPNQFHCRNRTETVTVTELS